MEFRIARVSAGLSQRQAAALAGISQTFVSSVERGVRCPTFMIASRVAAAVGHDLAVRIYPAGGVRIRDSGQVAVLEQIVADTAPAWHSHLELPIGETDRRAADLVLEGPTEILHVEAEGGIADLQAQLRAAQLKRVALAKRYDRPVRLIIALPDRRSLRDITSTHAALLSRAFPVRSTSVWRSIRTGSPLGSDGMLFVRLPNRRIHRVRPPADHMR
jgi:transcriptional regulator with XRE-family HTH domain